MRSRDDKGPRSWIRSLLGASLHLGVVFHLSRRYDQAVEEVRQTINMDPNFWLAH
jgi:hypothetical protein